MKISDRIKQALGNLYCGGWATLLTFLGTGVFFLACGMIGITATKSQSQSLPMFLLGAIIAWIITLTSCIMLEMELGAARESWKTLSHNYGRLTEQHSNLSNLYDETKSKLDKELAFRTQFVTQQSVDEWMRKSAVEYIHACDYQDMNIRGRGSNESLSAAREKVNRTKEAYEHRRDLVRGAGYKVHERARQYF